MNNKWLKLGLISLMSVSALVACGSKKEDVKTTEPSKETVAKPSSEQTNTSSETSTSSSSETTTSSTASTSSFTAKTYADTENMEFAINGKTYRVGETTLQTLIDDGVPFESRDLANINNNVDSNSESSVFNVTVGDYWTLQLSVGNFTESPAQAKDLPIVDLYFPVKQDKTQSVLTLNVPWNVTIDELKANAGEPTKVDHYEADGGYTSDTLEYKYESSRYLRPGGYDFDFVRGQLNAVHMQYIPK